MFVLYNIKTSIPTKTLTLSWSDASPWTSLLFLFSCVGLAGTDFTDFSIFSFSWPAVLGSSEEHLWPAWPSVPCCSLSTSSSLWVSWVCSCFWVRVLGAHCAGDRRWGGGWELPSGDDYTECKVTQSHVIQIVTTYQKQYLLKILVCKQNSVNNLTDSMSK